METKVPFTQKLSIALAFITYVFTIYSFFTQSSMVILIFFVLNSVFTLYSIYLAFLTRADSSEFQAMSDEIEELREELASTQENMSKKLSDSRRHNEELQESLDSLREEAGRYKDESSRLDREYKSLKKTHDQDKERDILPPTDEGDDDETLDIIEVARDAADEMRSYAAGAELVVNISTLLDQLLICANRQRIEILFRNIIDNSIKYAKRAGNLVITISTIGEDIFIVLKDNGEGLSEEETGHIFELNYQGSNRISGNGLGLAQAKAIVEYYGGTIYAKSTPGKGMGIYIQLPANSVADKDKQD